MITWDRWAPWVIMIHRLNLLLRPLQKNNHYLYEVLATGHQLLELERTMVLQMQTLERTLSSRV